MKYVYFCVLATLIMVSCNSSEEKIPAEKMVPVPLAIDSSKIWADSAMAIMDRVNMAVGKGIKGEVSNKKVNKIIAPMMKTYDSLYRLLKPEDTLTVYQYRLDKINEMIDLQMKYH